MARQLRSRLSFAGCWLDAFSGFFRKDLVTLDMQISVHGTQLDVGDSVRAQVERRLRNHHKRAPIHRTSAQSYVIAAEPDEATGEEAFEPVIVAGSTTIILTLTLSEAVMRMTLADLQVPVFHNSAQGGLNVLHRRPDGSIEWIEPDGPHRNPQGTEHGDR